MNSDLFVDPKTRERAQRVIIEIVRQCSGQLLLPTIRLMKVFYYAHDCYEIRNRSRLTEWPIPRVPDVQSANLLIGLIRELIENDMIKEIQNVVYLSLEDTELEPLSDSERYAVNTAISLVTLRQTAPDTPDRS